MLEVNPVTFILLVEGFVLVLVMLLTWTLISLIRKRRKSRRIVVFATQLAKSTRLRSKQLSAVQPADDDSGETAPNAQLEAIKRHETEFFRHLLASLKKGGSEQLDALDNSFDKIIKSCAGLQFEAPGAEEEGQVKSEEVVSLRHENETLRSELSVAKTQLNDLITEFGDLFGGGKGHSYALHEIAEMINVMKAEETQQQPLKVQK